MTDQERDATLAIALMAAFADGRNDDAEREQVRRIAESLSPGSSGGLTAIYQDVLANRRGLEDAAAALSTSDARQLAYEMAVAVCEADGVRGDGEKAFLERARHALGVDAGAAEALARQSEALATVPLGPPAAGAAPGAGSAGAGAAAAAGGSPGAPAAGGAVRPDPAALDQKILNYAILNGALELLPESLATMAIIPLQMKMVYEVGAAHGYALDRGHVSELLATVGVGLTSQAVEQVGRKILGGILGRIGGGLLGGLGRQATSSGLSFATTYALGQVAKDYYAGGRRLDSAQLRQSFDRMLGDAKALAQRYAGQIESKSRTIDPKQIVSMVRGR
jgi:uncharacterized protein (DUF697 family)/tellurite resistance protein